MESEEVLHGLISLPGLCILCLHIFHQRFCPSPFQARTLGVKGRIENRLLIEQEAGAGGGLSNLLCAAENGEHFGDSRFVLVPSGSYFKTVAMPYTMRAIHPIVP